MNDESVDSVPVVSPKRISYAHSDVLALSDVQEYTVISYSLHPNNTLLKSIIN